MKHHVARRTDDGTAWQGYWPFGGNGSLPASKAGPVAEVWLPASAKQRTVRMHFAKSVTACSWDGEDCRQTHCCKVVGSKCYEKKPVVGYLQKRLLQRRR